ncbi:multidrug ABC transporter ATP-binding protein [Candidatus Bathyarchaeota archaeon RBG_16_57_9]|jgi:ABC-2 type transport system ATP-binding protein|nr:MAG: multidrug ABC transporter ATP-binding protein [Candidatus Bathyarchaeota archaeon RBG_16_57_9]OGD55868.1 MAG: multidrug ABC transporter ATP-binding protein [Candidatus Bathyarchaeota archaeon RBG_13_60_20]
MDAIEVRQLTKDFGNTQALRGASFSVREHEIFGLIGPNGAGKTTALRILSTLISASSGKAQVFGFDVARQPEKVREILSYLPEDAGAYQMLSGLEFLEFMAGFYSKDRAEMKRIVDEGRKISGLGERLSDRVNGYSKGMKRRLLIARALMMKPRLAILDEPTSGLDVIQSFHVRNMIREYADTQGVTVLLSSHNMLEVEYLCGYVALIDGGVIIAEGTPEALKERYGGKNLEDVFMEVTKSE